MWIKRDPVNSWFTPHGPSILSEDQRSKSHARSDVHDAATSPPYRDNQSRSIGRFWCCHVACDLKIFSKIDIKLEKLIFNSGKSLEIH